MKTCKDCKYCHFKESDISPGGVMIIDYYECTNAESELFGNVSSVIYAQNSQLDGRNDYCEYFTKEEINVSLCKTPREY